MADALLLDRLLHLTSVLGDDMDRAFAGTGLTPSRTHLLWVAAELGPATQQRLAAALGVSARNVTGLVDALQRHGYLVRSSHPTDRRAVLVELTELGTSTVERMRAERIELDAAITAPLQPSERDELDRLLELVSGRLGQLVREHAAARAERPA